MASAFTVRDMWVWAWDDTPRVPDPRREGWEARGGGTSWGGKEDILCKGGGGLRLFGIFLNRGDYEEVYLLSPPEKTAIKDIKNFPPNFWQSIISCWVSVSDRVFLDLTYTRAGKIWVSGAFPSDKTFLPTTRIHPVS